MRRKAHFGLAVAAVATAVTGATIWAYERERGRAVDAARRGGSILQTEAGAIEYAETGAGAPLLSIHGAGGGYDQGLANAASLVGDAFRVIAPSRFGYLRTPIPPDASAVAQADAHAALLSVLGVSKAIVLGVSAGARSAVELALRHPGKVSALILIVPGTYSPTSPVAVDASRGSRFVLWLANHGADFAWWCAEKIAPSVLIRFVGVRPDLVARASPSERREVMRLVRSIQPLSQRFPGINLDSAPNLHELPLSEIRAPTLIVSTRDDLFNTLPAAEFAARRILNARLIVFDTGGHLLVGHAEEVRAEVRSFLASAGVTAATLTA